MKIFKASVAHIILLLLVSGCSTIEVSKAPSDIGIHHFATRYHSGICEPFPIVRVGWGWQNKLFTHWRDNGGFRSAGVLVGYENLQLRGQSCHLQGATAYQGKFRIPIGDIPADATITDARIEFRSRTIFHDAYGIQDARYCREIAGGRFFAEIGKPTEPIDTNLHSSGPLIEYDNPVHLFGTDIAGTFVRRSMNVTRRVQFARRTGEVVDIVISPVDEWIDRPFDASGGAGIGTHCGVWIKDVFLHVTYVTSP